MLQRLALSACAYAGRYVVAAVEADVAEVAVAYVADANAVAVAVAVPPACLDRYLPMIYGVPCACYVPGPRSSAYRSRLSDYCLHSEGSPVHQFGRP